MKSSRFILTALLAAALTGGVMTATASMARPHFPDSGYGCYGCPGGYGPGYGWNGNSGLTSEQQNKYTKIVQDYAKRMDSIQDQIFVKRQELRALRNATNPDVKTVRETATELTKLNKQLDDLHDEMAQRIEKEVGTPAGVGANSGNYGPRYHHGMGYGYGMGYGHRMGYGLGYGQGMMDNN